MTKVSFVCLASGYGTKLKPLTNYLKKEMYPILDMPFIAYSLLNVKNFSDEVTILVGPKKEQIQSYFTDMWQGLKVTYVEQMSPRGTGDALRMVYKQISMRTAKSLHSMPTIRSFLSSWF